jgi:electron transfer flavoprotein beta subunit
MNITVVVKLVPDLVEEITIDEGGLALDTDWLRMIISEADNHALEQAVLLKEAAGGTVTVLAPHAEDVDDVLFAAAARGADRLVKLTGNEESVSSHALARGVFEALGGHAPDLLLTGVQAHDDLDGSLGPLVAAMLGTPYVGYVAGVTLGEGTVTVRKEYPGGLLAEMEVQLPATLGVQVAEQPPRYVAVSKIRQAMKTAEIEEVEVLETGEGEDAGVPSVTRMYLPEAAERATMLDGDEDEIAESIVGVLEELGVL